jgi:hypothetical protein
MVTATMSTRLHGGGCRHSATAPAARRFHDSRAHSATTPGVALLTPPFASSLPVTRGVAAPRLDGAHSATTPATRCCHRGRHATTPTTGRYLRLDTHPTPTTPRCDGARLVCSAPAALRGGSGFLMSALVAACCDSSHCALSFSRDYRANASSERNGAVCLRSFRIELTDTDVLVGDVHLTVLVAVRLCPRFCFARRPPVVATEE